MASTIESVLSQTFTDYEFIIIDDGSVDNSAQIIAEYATKDKRIIPIYQHNSGKPKALNLGAARAQGKFLAFLDHDDLMLPERLVKQVEMHDTHPEIDASSCHCYYVDEEGNLQGVQRFPFVKTIEEARAAVAKKEIVCCAFTGLIITKKAYLAVGGLRSQFWPCDDLDFFNRLLENNYVLIIMQEVLMKYRIHANATSVSNQWHMFQMIQYTNQCVLSRRSGKPEISFDAFKAMKEQESWWVKLDEKRYHYSLVFHREAGLALHAKRYGKFSWLIITASLLSPKFVYHTALNKLKKQKPAMSH